MRKFDYEIDGKEYRVVIEEITGSESVIRVNGETYHVRFRPPAAAEKPAPVKAAPDGPAPPPAPEAATPASPGPAAASALAVTAPMPRVVLDLKVQAGDVVKKGDVLLIIEAMKMENEIRAGRDGKIKAVNVQAGVKVNTGDVMLEFE